MDELRCLVYDGYSLVSRERVGIQQVDIDDLHQICMLFALDCRQKLDEHLLGLSAWFRTSLG